MKYLHLDPDFHPYGKSIAHKVFDFNGGEPHLQITEQLNETDSVMITLRPKNFRDIGLMLLATDALRRMEIQSLELLIPYFPAARQDRVMVPGEPLSVKVYTDLINAQNFKRVLVFDPHSEVTGALLERATIISNHEFVKACIGDKKDLLLISPDGGALKKIYKVSSFLGGIPVVECSKIRDVKNGQLTGFTVYAEDLNGKPCYIVDDICDGGGTFLGLAKELKAKNSGPIYLIVSHGIFSKGFEELSQHFAGIFTTNAFSTIENKSLTQIKLEDLI